MAGLKLVIPTVFSDSTLPVLPPTPTVITSDTFDRADTNPGVLGVTDGGKGGAAGIPWSSVPQLHIIGKRMGSTGLTTTRFPRVDVGRANSRVEVRILGALAGGVISRASDDANYYAAYTSSSGNVTLDKRVGGVVTVLSSAPHGTVSLGDYLALKVSGSKLTVFLNSVELFSVTDTSHATATSCGVRTSYNDDASRFDEFLVTDI